MEWYGYKQTDRQNTFVCIETVSLLPYVLNHCIYVQEVQRKLSRCTQPLYLCTGSTAKTITMYSNILFMYRKYSANYHDVLKYWIYVHEVLQRKLSPCTQPLYLCTESTAQTITMYLNIGFMYMRCYSANYHLALNHVFIYVHDVLQRKPSLYTLKLYLFTRSTAQTLAIVVMYRRCYSANYHYVLNYCIYVQEVLQRKISLCTQTLYLCTGDARAQNITMYLNFVFMYRRCYSAKYHYVLNHCIYVQEVLQGKLSLCI